MRWLWRRFQEWCLWLVWDSNVRLGFLAPYIFGLGLGRMPHRVDKKGGKNKMRAFMRWSAFWLLRPFVRRGLYENYVGYKGWYELGNVCLAFEKHDGGLQFSW